MSDKRHVVLAEPGDLLIIRRVGDLDSEHVREVREALSRYGIAAILFCTDVNMTAGRFAVVSSEDPAN
jgi:hypothetical protein